MSQSVSGVGFRRSITIIDVKSILLI